tara:strand:+ start:59 stop:385 length:327 start_codon:yes stop_codon:yes gene_type:complete
METVEIATEDGTRRVKARPCVVAGLCITGSRGDWRITHVASGKIVCRPSIYNTNITLSRIRNAVFAAESTGFVLNDSVDWTANEAGLLAQSGLVLPWIKQVIASVEVL